MRISADLVRCEGHGVCADVAPALFQLDEEGELALVAGGQVPAGREREAEHAARVCPVGALRLNP